MTQGKSTTPRREADVVAHKTTIGVTQYASPATTRLQRDPMPSASHSRATPQQPTVSSSASQIRSAHQVGTCSRWAALKNRPIGKINPTLWEFTNPPKVTEFHACRAALMKEIGDSTKGSSVSVSIFPQAWAKAATRKSTAMQTRTHRLSGSEHEAECSTISGSVVSWRLPGAIPAELMVATSLRRTNRLRGRAFS